MTRRAARGGARVAAQARWRGVGVGVGVGLAAFALFGSAGAQPGMLAGVSAGAGALMAASATSATFTTVRDDRGVAITLSAPPRRIVSLLPSITESLCALGACARLVATDRFSNWPAAAAALPKLGGLDDAPVEAIVALKPDLVFASSSARITGRLEALGVRVVVLESRNHADVERTLGLLGRLLGATPAADALWAGIEQQTRAAAGRVPPRWRGQRVYFEIDTTPFAAGTASFIGETLARLGLANAIPAVLGAFPKLNPEYVVQAQPDLVMAERNALDDMPRRPGWSGLRALRAHQTCGFPGPRYDVLVRPGPRMGEAAALVADCLVALDAPR